MCPVMDAAVIARTIRTATGYPLPFGFIGPCRRSRRFDLSSARHSRHDLLKDRTEGLAEPDTPLPRGERSGFSEATSGLKASRVRLAYLLHLFHIVGKYVHPCGVCRLDECLAGCFRVGVELQCFQGAHERTMKRCTLGTWPTGTHKEPRQMLDRFGLLVPRHSVNLDVKWSNGDPSAIHNALNLLDIPRVIKWQLIRFRPVTDSCST